MDKLYIPYGIKSREEFFDGFGKAQLKQALVSFFIFLIIGLFVYVLTTSVLATVIIAAAGIGGSIMLVIKDDYNQSMLDQVQNIMRFRNNQQTYAYIYNEFD